MPVVSPPVVSPPVVSPPTGERAAALVLPSRQDPVVAGASTAIGGPPGRHTRLSERRFWTPVRWLVLLTLLTSLLGFWQKSPCRVHPWQDEYQYTRACYSDVFALYFSERLVDGRVPYVQHPVEYPVVVGAVMAVAAGAVSVFPQDQRPRRFYDLTWALLTAFAVVLVVTTARLAGRRRIWDAALVALSPALLLHGSTNWDLVAAAFAGLGLLQWARRRPVAAGVLLGLGTATKLYPLFLLVPLGLLCLRAGRLRAWTRTAIALVLTAAAVTVPVYLVSPSFAESGGQQVPVAGSPLSRFGTEGLAALAPHVTNARTAAITPAAGCAVSGINATWRFVELSSTRGADWDSLWLQLQQARGTPLDEPGCGGVPHRLNALFAAGFVLLLAGIAFLVWRAPRRPRVAQVLFLTLLAFLLPSKVFSPQYVIWLVPLAVLARPRWRPFLAWQATEVLLLFTRFYFFVGNDVPGQGIGQGWFFFAVLLRDAALLWFAGLVVRDVLHPERDLVRRDGVDDPAGGVLDGVPDRRRTSHPGAAPEREAVPVG